MIKITNTIPNNKSINLILSILMPNIFYTQYGTAVDLDESMFELCSQTSLNLQSFSETPVQFKSMIQSNHHLKRNHDLVMLSDTML